MGGNSRFLNYLRGFEVRLMVPFVVMVLAIVGIMTLVTFIVEKQRVAGQLYGLAVVLVRNLAMNSELAVFAENADYDRAPLHAIMGEKDVLFSGVYNADGKRIAQRSKVSIIPPVRDDIMRKVMKHSSPLTVLGSLDNGRRFIDAYAPVFLKEQREVGEPGFAGQRVIGVARVALSTNALDKQMREVALGGISVLLLFSLLGVAAAIVVARKVTKPVMELAKGAHRIGSGHLSERIELHRSDEIGQLADAFNEMAKALDMRTQELYRKNKDMEAFMYSVSHDLKSPLASIKGMVLLLERFNAGKLDERSMHYIQRIKFNCDWMERLITWVLNLSRLGNRDIGNEAVDMMQVTRDVMEYLSHDIESRGIRVILPPAMPAVYGEQDLLAQVMQNLIGNAVKFIGKDNKQPVIEVGWRRNQRDEVIFFVKDNGIGIPHDKQEFIFGLFQRLTSDDDKGSGIGLAVVKRIVELHGGRVWVESEVNKGSTFFFTLPLEVH